MAARFVSVVRSTLLVGSLLTCSLAARAANNCPWLNEATASSILEGSANGVYVQVAGENPATCTFTHGEGARVRQLIISVEIATNPHDRMLALVHDCEERESIASIGNEAMRCIARTRGGAHGERIVGRVRNQVFTISLVTTAKQDSVFSAHELSTRSTTAAEQVSGNLF